MTLVEYLPRLVCKLTPDTGPRMLGECFDRNLMKLFVNIESYWGMKTRMNSTHEIGHVIGLFHLEPELA